MGRQKRYQRDETVEKAMNLFWKNGFNGTSMRDLEKYLDMRPGSIYATFGSKEGLYTEALERYFDYSKQQLQDCLDSTDNIQDALKQYIAQLTRYGDGVDCPPCYACMLIKTLSDLDPETQQIKLRAQALMGDFYTALSGVLGTAQEQGDIPEDVDIARLTRFAQTQISGLRDYMHMNHPDETVLGLREDVHAALLLAMGKQVH